ncbi:MAG: SAM-dependent DNA methyltransferase [Candidatus Aegiribacteria sp.]|nr:SAM-dependent DNA methyltransferase [Candidatus Aegiribacteria sp.]
MKDDSKLKGKRIQNPDAYDSEAHNTEWTCAARIAEWINNIVEEKNLGFGEAKVEMMSRLSKKRCDIRFTETKRSQKTLCIIEAKRPRLDVFNEELKTDARNKANQLKAPYFGTTNFKKLIWWDTARANDPTLPEEAQIIEKFNLSEILELNEIEHHRYKTPIKKGLERFLEDLYSYYKGEISKPKQAVDDFLVYRLQEKIRVLSLYYSDIIYNKYHKDKEFRKELKRWFVEQGWSFANQQQDYDKVARQTAYLLVNKILFYDLLQSKRPTDLDKLEVPEHLTKGSLLRKQLQAYFDDVIEGINYETIYTTDFIDQLAFPNAEEVVIEVRELVNVLDRYDFSTLGYDIIGRIFERLIPAEERHYLGQYFTSPDIVDIILSFCLKHEDDKILDPACGAGTFLVRAYQHKIMMNQMLKHTVILDRLWGTDIAKFPAHLSTINLAINGLDEDKNYPNIIREDFFEMHVGPEGCELEDWRKRRAKTLGVEERDIVYPRWFDAVVGNPPYTRQEEIEDIAPDVAEYKKALIESSVKNLNGEKIANISKRAGIHAYFFVHGTKFLRNGGRFGFIVSNSWLDVDYGKGLQEFFLKNYKIIAIIESKVERWFEEADVNTCIVILEKCADKKERDTNIARFAYLKKPVRHFVPPAHDMWEKKLERKKAIDAMRRTILAHEEIYENEELRIYTISQKELWKEGYSEETKKYVGAKWGKYLRAPKIFFRILEIGKDKLVPLKEIADVRFGIKTGANDFFYLTEDEINRKGIEKEFWMHKDNSDNWIPNYVIKSPKECKTMKIKHEDLKYRILMIHKDKNVLRGTNILKFINAGERKGYHKRPTCAGRKRWYELPELPHADILFRQFFNTIFNFPLKEDETPADHTFYYLCLKNKNIAKPVASLLNSSIYNLIIELYGRTVMGQGVLIAYGPEIEPIPLINPEYLSNSQINNLTSAFNKLSQRNIGSVFSEIGAESPEYVLLEKVKPDRRELDKIIFGILGLTEAEQLAVYKAVVDLVKSRIEKAKSVKKNNKTNEGIHIAQFVKSVMNEIGDDTLGRFYREKVLNQKELITKSLHNTSSPSNVREEIFGWVVEIGKELIECRNEDEGKFIAVFNDAGMEKLNIPEDVEYLSKILPDLLELKGNIDHTLKEHLEPILSQKTRDKLSHALWVEIIK